MGRSVGYIIERIRDRQIFNGYRKLKHAKAALVELCAKNEYRIVAINEYQGYMFEGPHMYYVVWTGEKLIKYKG